MCAVSELFFITLNISNYFQPGMSGGNKANLSKKEIDDILRFGTEELFNQVRSNKMNFTNLKNSNFSSHNYSSDLSIL